MLAFYLTPMGRSIYRKINAGLMTEAEAAVWFTNKFPINFEDKFSLMDKAESIMNNEEINVVFQIRLDQFKTRKSTRRKQRLCELNEVDHDYEYEDQTPPAQPIQPSTDFDTDESDAESIDPDEDGTAEDGDLFEDIILPAIIEQSQSGDDTSEADQTDDDTDEMERLVEETLDEAVDQEMSEVRIEGPEVLEDAKKFTIDDIANYLFEVAEKWNFSPDQVVLAFSEWLMKPSQLTKAARTIIKQNKLLECWKYFEMVEEFRDLSKIAQLILATPSSEASCERLFWKQRKILTNEFNRTGKQLAFSRLVLMTQLE